MPPKQSFFETHKKNILITSIVVLVIVILVVFFVLRSRNSDDYEFTKGSLNNSFVSTSTTLSGEPIVQRSDAISISAPRVNERVGSPIIIRGDARTFENVVHYRLLDAQGKVVSEGYTTATAPDVGQFGPFRGELTYTATVDGEGTLEIYEESAKDGSRINVVSIPVRYTRTPEFMKG